MLKVIEEHDSKPKHIIVNEIVHKQLLGIKPKGVQFNYLLQYLMIKAGLLDKNDPELMMTYKYLCKKNGEQ